METNKLKTEKMMEMSKQKIEEIIEASNKELKQRFPTLSDEMIVAVRGQNLKHLKKFYTNTIERNKVLEQELGAARRIIWGVLHTVGRKVKIPDNTMVMAENEENEIVAHYDAENKETVLSAKEKESRIITDF